ncbi:MAG: GTPase Era [Candidatus Methanofastidiosum methylothiophilum]|uniref:GTPase Era n=1 Tax=Candidatus Methanofastidiosum methylothiophilum TaxID=1705564 RepID=A0A150II00_9EURY|nr:MAG: GTPase Era [Candidatus Methanofastidiosum methylthiophilus]KYC46704.1 MAG: GTPase Era [Candidatus Methanofastidiosum methylthiophilus]KYC49814.1 MAG: GTPase Era [Candidatus Methanofastidiosum methylthiophilus]
MAINRDIDLMYLAEEIQLLSPHNFEDGIISIKDRIKTSTLSLAVLGQFKRGKTSFINALIGEPILPTAVIPVTSIITILKYHPEKLIKVVFLNKEEKIIKFNEIEKYVTEKGNPDNKKGVKLVEVNYPLDYLKKGILLIDTPGIGSTFLKNSEVTYNYLENIDAAIFLLTADQPVSNAELDFLKDIKNHAHRFFFILNKIDYLSENQLVEILNFNKNILEKELNQEIEIFPISSKWAIEGKSSINNLLLKKSGMSQFEDLLNNFLLHKKNDTLMASIKNKLLNLTNGIISYYEIEKKIINTPLGDLESKLEKFKEGIEIIIREHSDAEPIIKAEIKRIMESVDSDLSYFKKGKDLELIEKLESRFKEVEKMEKDEIVCTMMKYYTDVLESIFEGFRLEEEKKVIKSYEKIIHRFSEKTEKTIEDIRKLSSELFEVDIPHIETKDTFTIEKGLYYRAEPLLYTMTEQFNYILPSFAFKKTLLNKIRSNVTEHIDMNCGRIRADFLYRLNEESRRFIGTLDEKVNFTVNYLESAVEKGIIERKKTYAEVKKIENELNKKIERIKEINLVISS